MRRRIATCVGLLSLISATCFGGGDDVIGTEPPIAPPAVLTVVPTIVPTAESGFEQLGQRLQPVLKKRFPKCALEIVGQRDRILINGSVATSQEAAAIVAALQTVVDYHWLTVGPQPERSIRDQQIINLLEIPGEAQVLLRVNIIEADRDSASKTFQRVSQSERTTAKPSPQPPAAPETNSGPQTGVFSTSVVERAATQLSKVQSAKPMCQPSMTVLSGHAASFISGGKFAEPTIAGVGGAEGTTTSFRVFGTSVQVKPTVIGGEQLRLELECESSRLDEANNVAGIPGMTISRVNTQVLLKPDQSVVMVLPTPPAKEPANSEKCLFVTVTPEVLKPMTPNEVSPQPSAAFPTRPDVYTLAPYSASPLLFGLGSAPVAQLMPAVPPPLVRDLLLRTPLPTTDIPQPSPPAFGPLQQLGGWQPMPPVITPWPSQSMLSTTSRLEHLKSALKHLQAAGLTDQVAEIQKAIELERKSEARRELKQRERELGILQGQIESLRRSLSPEEVPQPE